MAAPNSSPNPNPNPSPNPNPNPNPNQDAQRTLAHEVARLRSALSAAPGYADGAVAAHLREELAHALQRKGAHKAK